jgi:ABC-type glycerol-3-phosphate transport system permease component
MVAFGVAVVCVVSAIIAYVLSRLRFKLVGLLFAVLVPALISYGLAWTLFMSPWSHPSEDAGGIGSVIAMIWSGCGVLVGLVSYTAFWRLQVWKIARRSNNRFEY